MNIDLVETTRVENTVLIFLFVDNTQLALAYPDSAAAYFANSIFVAATAATSSGLPTLISVSPSSVITPSGPTLFNIYGTDFRSTAVISVSGTGPVPTTFVSSTNLQITLNIVGAPGGYDVDYLDGAGDTSHLANGITLV